MATMRAYYCPRCNCSAACGCFTTWSMGFNGGNGYDYTTCDITINVGGDPGDASIGFIIAVSGLPGSTAIGAYSIDYTYASNTWVLKKAGVSIASGSPGGNVPLGGIAEYGLNQCFGDPDQPFPGAHLSGSWSANTGGSTGNRVSGGGAIDQLGVTDQFAPIAIACSINAYLNGAEPAPVDVPTVINNPNDFPVDICYAIDGVTTCITIPPGEQIYVPIPFQPGDPPVPWTGTYTPPPTPEIPNPPAEHICLTPQEENTFTPAPWDDTIYSYTCGEIPPPTDPTDPPPVVIVIPGPRPGQPDPTPTPDPDPNGDDGIDGNYQGCLAKTCETEYIYEYSADTGRIIEIASGQQLVTSTGINIST